MGNHENIVMLHNVFKADNDRDLYLVFEYMETDLHAVIRANILEEIHKQYIMYQAFKALLYMHSAELVHRDMKPSNLLLNSECLMKVADFGLARSLLNTDEQPASKEGAHTKMRDNPYYIDDNPILTDYVATRWYRAPEILVGSLTYHIPVDLWSLGCIFGEMIGGKPVFPGTSTLNQIEKVGEVLGPPSGDDVEALQSTFVCNMLDQMLFPNRDAGSDGKRPMIPFNKKSMPEPRPRTQVDISAGAGAPWADEAPNLKAHDEATRRETWRRMYPKASDDAIDLLLNLMVYDPTKRYTARDGLEHAYCAQFHDPDSEVTYAVKVRGKEGEKEEKFVRIDVHDNKKLSVKKYQEHIYTMCKKGDDKGKS
jgi:mitogen-activated protein kinase 15